MHISHKSHSRNQVDLQGKIREDLQRELFWILGVGPVLGRKSWEGLVWINYKCCFTVAVAITVKVGA